MNRTFKRGERVRHPKLGKGSFGSYMSTDTVSVMFDRTGHRVVNVQNLTALTDEMRWAEVQPGDTAEFEAHGDILSIKAKGTSTQATVLGWKVTELDGVWDLLSIKKRNPPVPVHLGAKVKYRNKIWLLVYAAMVPNLTSTKHNMVWVEISEHYFNWVGHMDIDREKFEVIFTGWLNQ